MNSEKNKKNIETDWFELIIDDLTGNISIPDKEKLTEWINCSAENEEYYSELNEIWVTLGVIKDSERFSYKSAYGDFRKSVKESKHKKYNLKRLLKYVAIIVPILFGSYFTYLNFSEIPSENFTLNSISVPKGSTSKIEFKDGSKVWMNSGTEIELVDSGNNKERRIKLDGEAFLEIMHSKVLPFTVETGSAEVKVYGTIFNVNAYSDKKELRVTLESGSVEVVTDFGKKVKLTPSEQLVYNLETKLITIKEINLKKELAWKTNSLIFTGESFGEIIELLEKKFRVDIDVTRKELLETRFSGDFINGESIDQILAVMSFKGRFRYSIKENTINIY